MKWTVVLALALTGPSRLTAQVPDTAARWARITYLTTTTAYLDAGRDDGVQDSARVEVRRAGRHLATLRVSYLSSHRAACEIVDTTAALAVGDSARYVPLHRLPARAALAPNPAQSPARRGRSSLRGTLGLEYLSVSGNGARLSQPGLALQVYGGPAGSALSVGLDLRERRLSTATPGSPDAVADQSRVYQAVVRWQTPGSPVRLGLGRQYVDGMPSVGLIDGLQIEHGGPAWAAGAFVGTQPGLTDLGLSTDIRQLGGWVRRQGQPAGGGVWSLTAGASGSYAGWRTNREFVYLEARYFGPRLSGFLSQEIDYYRPWKRVGGEPALSPTASYGQVRYQVSEKWSVDGGVDERRNVRLFDDVVSPESTFDAAFRRGAWVGASIRPVPHVWVDLDARASDGGAIGRTDSYTGSLALVRLGPLGADLRGRGTYYVSPGRIGRLEAISAGVAPADRWRLAVEGGERDEDVAILSGPQIARWVSLSLDLSLAQPWFATISATRQRGAQQDSDQLFALFSYRF